MLLTNRIIWDDGGVLKDLSVNLNNTVSGTESVTIDFANDAIFVGSLLPFNRKYMRVSSANAVASTMSVAYFDGNTFVSAIDVIDETSDGTNTLATSGNLSWKTDKDESSWSRKDTDDMDPSISLSSLKIYDLYWAKFTFSGNASFTFDFLGYKFSDDEDLGVLYPQLNTSNIKTQFESGKTDWETQELEAGLFLFRDLRKRQEIVSADQLLDADQFRHASVYKVAEIIFNEFGDDYDDEYERAGNLYRESFKDTLKIDKNRNARLERNEAIEDLTLVRR